MTTSENGWPASEDRDALGITRLEINGAEFPGGIRGGEVATVLGYLATEFHERVEPLEAVGCWGYYYRPIRGSNVISNHSSGTAVDLNAPKHPQGKTGTFTDNQVQQIRAIIDEVGGVVRWGGDWDNPDEMHFEIYASADDVTRVANALKKGQTSTHPVLQHGDQGDNVRKLQQRLGIEDDGIFGDETQAAVEQFQHDHDLNPDGVVGARTWGELVSGARPRDVARPTLQPGVHGEHVLYLQQLLNKMFPAYSNLDESGQFDEATEAVVREFQTRSGITDDGAVGPETWAKLLGG